MSLQLPLSFESPSHPGHKIHYVYLNPTAPNTLLFCYGAGGSSAMLTLYQPFLLTHPALSLLCIDRWVLPHPSIPLLSTLSTLTLALLSHLSIQKVSIAAHSAGIYQALDLATRYPEVTTGLLFPISSHIPAPFTGSRIMGWMCSMPNFLFVMLGKIDQLEGTKVERALLKVLGSPKIEAIDDGTFVFSKELREVLRGYEPSEEERKRRRERLDVDYRLGYSRVDGMGIEDLVNLYRSCKGRLTWFTCDADVFFGPASVERMLREMGECRVEVVNVKGAAHSDILFRSEVWERIYEQVLRVVIEPDYGEKVGATKQSHLMKPV